MIKRGSDEERARQARARHGDDGYPMQLGPQEAQSQPVAPRTGGGVQAECTARPPDHVKRPRARSEEQPDPRRPLYDPAMIYRFARAIAELFPFLAFAFFVGAFFVALAFTVLYPIVPIILLMVSIPLLVLAVAFARVLRFVERTAAKRGLRRDRCPACDEGLERYTMAGEPLKECVRCQRVFDATGAIWQRTHSLPLDTPREAASADAKDDQHARNGGQLHAG